MGVKVKHWKGAYWVFVNFKGRRKAKRCASQKAAELARDKIDAALKLGQTDALDADRRPLPPPVPTFAEYTERWLAGTVHLRPQTIEQYRSRLKLRILPTLGPLPLTAITRETVRTLIGQMAQGPNRRSPDRLLARATVRETLRTLSVILSTAEDDGVIPFNPARRMGKYLGQGDGGEETREVEVFSPEELARMLEAAARDWPEWYPFILCLTRTGMRLGEAIGLEWRDVDLADRVILIRRTRRRGRTSEPKNTKARRVDMSQQLCVVLRGLKTLQEAESVVNSTPPPERVFSTPKGTAIDEVGFRVRVWARLLRQAGIRYRKPHALRHTFASLLIEHGEPLTYVQRQLGHHSPAFTLEVYGHLLPRGDRRAVDALDDTTSRNPGATVSPVGTLTT